MLNQSTCIMFHHFHHENAKHYAQGSVTQTKLENLILKIGPKNFLSPHDWIIKHKNKDKKSYCLTFDDALLSQYKYAIPILKKYNIKGIFFIYSSVFFNKIDEFEIFRKFRYSCYPSFSSFFNEFISEYYDLGFKKINLNLYKKKLFK